MRTPEFLAAASELAAEAAYYTLACLAWCAALTAVSGALALRAYRSR